MSIQISEAPGSPFTQPFGLLRDCHRRVERFLAQIVTVAEGAGGAELLPVQREALEVALRYFRQGAPLHTADEEQSLFPRLRASAHPDALRALAAVDQLEADHEAAAALHEEADRLGQAWLDAGSLDGADTARLTALARDLRAMYERHIRVEDEEVFPLAESALDDAAVAEIGREMAVRRGLDPDRLPTVSRCAQRRATPTTAADGVRAVLGGG